MIALCEGGGRRWRERRREEGDAGILRGLDKLELGASSLETRFPFLELLLGHLLGQDLWEILHQLLGLHKRR